VTLAGQGKLYDCSAVCVGHRASAVCALAVRAKLDWSRRQANGVGLLRWRGAASTELKHLASCVSADSIGALTQRAFVRRVNAKLLRQKERFQGEAALRRVQNISSKAS